jgi:hypothetical protein
MKPLVIAIGAIIALTLISKGAKASEQLYYPPIHPGEIINTETNIAGNCADNNCLINKNLLIYSTFKNIGNFTKTNKIGIKIDNIIVKNEYITLNPNQEYTMIHTSELHIEKPYNICGYVE